MLVLDRIGSRQCVRSQRSWLERQRLPVRRFERGRPLGAPAVRSSCAYPSEVAQQFESVVIYTFTSRISSRAARCSTVWVLDPFNSGASAMCTKTSTDTSVSIINRRGSFYVAVERTPRESEVVGSTFSEVSPSLRVTTTR